MVPIIYAISLHGAGFAESIWPDCDQTGYSSVGRASDCRHMQQSDGPWFDSGWPDFFRTLSKPNHIRSDKAFECLKGPQTVQTNTPPNRHSFKAFSTYIRQIHSNKKPSNAHRQNHRHNHRTKTIERHRKPSKPAISFSLGMSIVCRRLRPCHSLYIKMI